MQWQRRSRFCGKQDVDKGPNLGEVGQSTAFIVDAQVLKENPKVDDLQQESGARYKRGRKQPEQIESPEVFRGTLNGIDYGGGEERISNPSASPSQ